MKKGDIVTTSRGCRIAGNPGKLKVIKTGLKWSTYDAVLCEKSNGKQRLFLKKNLKELIEGEGE